MTTEATLLAQIYADPAADGPRLVYADYLQERDDPRGELIALQILNRHTPRERELLDRHAAQWLGPLAEVIDLHPNAQTTFERGFLAIAEIKRDAGPRLQPLLHDPTWSTVEEIRGWDSDIVLAQSPLPNLRRLESALPIDRLRVLAQRATPLANLAELVVSSFGPFSDEDRAYLGHCEGLPNLRELVIAANFALTIDDILWLVDSPISTRLERLVIRRPGRPRTLDADEHRAVDAIAQVLTRTQATVPKLAITTPAAPVELARSSTGLYALAALLVVFAIACSTKKRDEPAPAAAPKPVRLYTEAEIKTFQSALDARLQATKARHCTRPLLRGTAAPSSAHDALVELAVPHGSFGECLQRFTSAKATNADLPVFLALDRECGDEVEAAIIAAVSHDDACSPYQVGIGVLPETLAPILRSADAIGTRAHNRAKADPAGAIALVADGIRAYQDLARGQTNLIVAMISVAAEKTLLGHAHAILDGSHLTAPQLTALAATFDALLATEPSFGDTMLGEADSFELFLGYARAMPADWTPPGGWDQGLRTLEAPDLGTKTDPRDYAALMMEWSELRHKNLATACPSTGTLAACYGGLGAIATRTAAIKPFDPNVLTADMIALAGSGDPASLDATRHRLRESLVAVLERVAAASFQPYAAKRALPIAQLASARIELEVLRLGHCPNAATLNSLLAPAALGEPLVAARTGAQLAITPPAWVGDTTPWLVPCP